MAAAFGAPNEQERSSRIAENPKLGPVWARGVGADQLVNLPSAESSMIVPTKAARSSKKMVEKQEITKHVYNKTIAPS